MNKRITTLTAGTMLVALAVTGCSTKAKESSGGGSGASGSLKTDVGVTDKEINLAVQTDTSGVFKVLGLGLTHGNELWAEDVNKAGGICGRTVKLDIQDNGYKADNALPLYETQKATNLGFVQLLGSPILAALKQKIIADKVTSATASWASSNLDAPEVLMIGQTYDIEIINGLAWMQKQGKIADGDKIGHIYIDSEYGQGGLMGSEAYAKDHDITVIKAPVGGTDTDMTATITKMKSEGVKAIAITTAPGAVSSAVVQNVAQGLNVPVIGSNPTFSPTMYTDQTVAEGLKNFYLISSTAPYGSDNELAKKVAKKYEARSKEAPNIGVMQAYVTGLVWGEVLKQACSDGDMTREGVLKAKAKVTSVNSQGLGGALDFSKEGAPSSREAYILQPDQAAPDKLKIAAELFESDEAKKYKAPHEK